jgi:DNA-binding ferritin-like protein (Dps family)
MKNITRKIAALSLMLTFMGVITTLAQEQKKMEHKHEMKGDHGKRQMKGHKQCIPNLTEEQKIQLKSVKTKLLKETLPLKNELREKNARLKTLTTTAGSSEKDINKMIEEIGALETKMMKVKVFSEIEKKEYLTEEQRLFVDTHASTKKRKQKTRH